MDRVAPQFALVKFDFFVKDLEKNEYNLSLI